MPYKISKYLVGQEKVSESYVLDYDIRDFCCVDGDIFFVHSEGIGLIHDGDIDPKWHLSLGYVDVPDFTSFNAICHNKENNALMIVGSDGARLYEVDINLTSFSFSVSIGDSKRFEKQYFSRPNSKVYVASKKGETIWSAKNLHRCFRFKSGRIEPLAGCGRAGHSISSAIKSKIFCPTGVVFMESIFCFNDCGNNCIRGVRDGSTFNIASDCKELKDIHYIDFRLFFLGDNKVHMLSSEGDATHLFEVYEGKEKILSFCPMSKSCIFIMEECINEVHSEETKGNQPT